MHAGWHDKSSYGATPYVVRRSPELGNLMIDSPRFNTRLARAIEEEGGLRYVYVCFALYMHMYKLSALSLLLSPLTSHLNF